MNSPEPGLIQKKLRLLMELRRAGIGDARVLGAIEKTPREKFVPASFFDQAYENTALPIAAGQTVSQPYVVALMTEKLEPGERHNVLEIGTGSGYQTAILARLCRRVFTIERHRDLLREAEARFAELRLHNIVCRLGDGSKGWPEQEPYDRVIVTAAAAENSSRSGRWAGARRHPGRPGRRRASRPAARAGPAQRRRHRDRGFGDGALCPARRRIAAAPRGAGRLLI